MPNSDGALRINIPEYYDLNKSLSNFDRTHNLDITNITELPFGPGPPVAERRRDLLSQIVGGWQVNNILSFYSGTPFSVTASGTSLNAPENDQRADQVVDDRADSRRHRRDSAYFDPLAFKPVTEARFGTAPFNVCAGRAWRRGTSACSGSSRCRGS